MADLKPGSTLRCTLTAEPRSLGAWHTVNRLMQMDPGVKKTLRRSQRSRRQQMISYIRGNRVWYKREQCGDSIPVKVGQTWTLPYSHQIARDLDSVKSIVSIG